MPDDERNRALARLKNQVARLAFDELERWIRGYAATVADPVRSSELLELANKRKADTEELIRAIERKI